MRTPRATRRLQYAIGHRVPRHESKCRHLHGHNFVFFLTFEAEFLDDAGRVFDFGEMKTLFGTWIEENWDHGFILWKEDTAALAAMDVFSRVSGLDQKVYVLPQAPTAENLAVHLLEVVGPKLLEHKRLRLVKVVVYETENGIAEAAYAND